mgnify:FL=1
MTLVRRNQNWLPSIFNDLFDGEMLNQYAGNTVPAINVKESQNGYTVEVAAPGMTKEDFNVRIDEENNLLISLEKKSSEEENKAEERYLRREFSYAKFQQTMILPDDVDKERIGARCDKGILTVDLPKMTQEQIKKAQRYISIE